MMRTGTMLLALSLLPGLAFAQGAATPTIKRGAAPATAANDGRQMFVSYCSPCHGKDGKGGGPAAAALKKAPADLTMLAKNHGGVMSAKDFDDTLNSAGMTAAHGDRDMPVWGPIFRNMVGNETLRTTNLRKYVEGLQVK
jgi:mono/diheme cytochrome c family protein